VWTSIPFIFRTVLEMAVAQFAELFRALSSGDNALRQKAETMYQQAKQNQPDQLIVGMMSVLGAGDVDTAVRAHCAVLLRQFTMKDRQKDFIWPKLPPANQQQFASELLRLFEAEASPPMQKKIGEVISKLAEYVCDKEDPRGSLAPGQPCGWPGLLQLAYRMANASAASSVDKCVASMNLLMDLVPTLQADVVASMQELGQILQLALTNPELKLKAAALQLVCVTVSWSEPQQWAPLAQTLGILVQVMQEIAQQGKEEMLQGCVQAMIEVASQQPDFFKAHLAQTSEPAKFMASLAKNRDSEAGIRGLAFEWLLSFLEKRAKWVTKSMPALTSLILSTGMDLMLELEDGESALKDWAARMDDEEGDDDEDLYSAGDGSMDRVAAAVEMEALGPILFPLIGQYASQAPWQAKHAALAAIKQTVEYLEEKSHVDDMAKLLLQHVEHQHPRVRFMALHAIGQMSNDQKPTFQEAWHSTFMPVFVKMMDDPVNRVSAMALSAFVAFTEPLDTTLMVGYARGFMEKLVAKLQSAQHRGVREECITSIAVIAGVIGKDFSLYYDGIMPLLKQFVMQLTGEKENRLRGKSFECMSLLGLAVGKDKFLPDAREAIQAMMSATGQVDDILREYIEQASERICKCLKKDFAPFLQAVLPGLIKNLALESSPAAEAAGQDSEYYQVTRGDGQVVQVHTDKFNELMQSLRLLTTYCTELEGAFYDCLAPAAQALLPLLSASNDRYTSYDDARSTALWTWALLIKAARAGAAERGLPPSVAGELLRAALQQTFQAMDVCAYAETLSSNASSLTECIKNGGPGVLTDGEIVQIAQKMFAMVDQSLARSAKKQAQRQGATTAAPGEDEEGEDEENEWEASCRQAYVEVLGSLMKVGPAEFLQLLPACGERLQQWAQSADNRVLALNLACALVEHLRERSAPLWPAFMPMALQALGDASAEVRTSAAYVINVASGIPDFGQAAPEAFRRLAQIVGGARPKKRDLRALTAYDNAVGALTSLAIGASGHCPPEVQAWSLILSKLPLRDDWEEAQAVHGKIVDQVAAQNQSLLGANNANLGTVLGIFAEIHQTQGICNEATDEKILKVFRMIPQQSVLQLASGFSEKQRKKVEKMLSA